MRQRPIPFFSHTLGVIYFSQYFRKNIYTFTTSGAVLVARQARQRGDSNNSRNHTLNSEPTIQKFSKETDRVREDVKDNVSSESCVKDGSLGQNPGDEGEGIQSSETCGADVSSDEGESSCPVGLDAAVRDLQDVFHHIVQSSSREVSSALSWSSLVEDAQGDVNKVVYSPCEDHPRSSLKERPENGLEVPPKNDLKDHRRNILEDHLFVLEVHPENASGGHPENVSGGHPILEDFSAQFEDLGQYQLLLPPVVVTDDSNVGYNDSQLADAVFAHLDGSTYSCGQLAGDIVPSEACSEQSRSWSSLLSPASNLSSEDVGYASATTPVSLVLDKLDVSKPSESQAGIETFCVLEKRTDHGETTEDWLVDVLRGGEEILLVGNRREEEKRSDVAASCPAEPASPTWSCASRTEEDMPEAAAVADVIPREKRGSISACRGNERYSGLPVTGVWVLIRMRYFSFERLHCYMGKEGKLKVDADASLKGQ